MCIKMYLDVVLPTDAAKFKYNGEISLKNRYPFIDSLDSAGGNEWLLWKVSNMCACARVWIA